MDWYKLFNSPSPHMENGNNANQVKMLWGLNEQIFLNALSQHFPHADVHKNFFMPPYNELSDK